MRRQPPRDAERQQVGASLARRRPVDHLARIAGPGALDADARIAAAQRLQDRAHGLVGGPVIRYGGCPERVEPCGGGGDATHHREGSPGGIVRRQRQQDGDVRPITDRRDLEPCRIE